MRVHSKPSVPPISRDAVCAAVWMRSIWIECVPINQPSPTRKPFAEGTDWHGMQRLRLRKLELVNCEALMRAAGQNLKRLLKKRGWRHRPGPAEAISAFFLASFRWFAAPYGVVAFSLL